MRTVVAKFGKYAVAMAVAVLAAPTSALAEPFVLTSGNFFFTRFDNATLSASPSSDTTIGAYLGRADARGYDPPYICDTGECGGRTFNLSVSDSLTRTPDSRNNAVGGVFNLGSSLYFVDAIEYSIVAGSVVGQSDGAASTWFRFTAMMTGKTTAGLPATLQLTGGGSAIASWNSRFGWVSTNYKFEDPAAVPEPATLLLLGTGLAAIGRLRRRGARCS